MPLQELAEPEEDIQDFAEEAAAEATETEHRETEPDTAPVASLSDRFAALLIDATLLTYVFLLGGPALKTLVSIPAGSPWQWEASPRNAILGMGAGVVFLYFVLFEGVIGRTPGKLLCRLSVQNKTGGAPSLFGVVIRNLFRFVDLALFPLTGFGFAEASIRNQRLGDVLGGTSVRRALLSRRPVVSLSRVEWGSITRRLFALAVDLGFFGAAILAYILAIPIEQETTAKIALQVGPIFLVAYWVFCESFLGGTPGKLIFGLRVVDERARPVRIGSSLIRTIFRLFDHNPLGYLCAVLASHKQRPGDLAAQTSVIRTGWSLRGLVSLIIFALLLSGMAYWGINNEQNFVRTGHVLKIGRWSLPELPSQLKYYLGLRLQVHNLHFGRPQAPIGTEPSYAPGEIVYMTADVSGFIIQDGRTWLQHDLLVRGPQGESIIDILNVINKSFTVGHEDHQQLTSSFLLPLKLDSGRYQVRFRVRDRYGNMTGDDVLAFHVR